MKKALLIGLVLGLIAVWAVPAMAVDMTASGFIGIRGYVFKNAMPVAPPFTGVPASSGFNDDMGSFMNARGELGFTFAASEDLFGVFRFRMDSTRFGDDQNQANRWAAVGGGQIAVQVQELFIDFRMPPKLPLWFRVGLQPVAIRPWIFYFNSCPGVSTRVMIDPIKLGITGYFAKMADPDAWTASGGAELYAIDAKMPLSFGNVNIAPGVFFAYQNTRFNATLNPDASQIWWLGINVDGGIGPVKMQVDFIYNDGSLENTNIADQDYGSWLINGQLSFVWQKLEVGVAGKYVEGEDADSNDIETFQLPGGLAGSNIGLASEAPAISGDFIVFDNGWFTVGPGWPGMGLIDGPSTWWYGYWDVRMFAYYQIFDWLKVGAQLGYIGDTVSGAAGTANDAIGTDNDDDDSIGWEMDFGVNVQIYKNLALETGFGYLFGGKALSLVGGVEPDDPWAFQSRLMYFF